MIPQFSQMGRGFKGNILSCEGTAPQQLNRVFSVLSASDGSLRVYTVNQEKDGSTSTFALNEDLKKGVSHTANIIAVYDPYMNSIDPAGNKLDAAKGLKASENKEGLADVDGDGYEELVYQWTSTITANMVGRVFQYDPVKGTWVKELQAGPVIEFFANGTAKTNALRMNRGTTTYGVQQHDAASDTYSRVGGVDSWLKSIDSSKYPSAIDSEGFGEMYTIADANGKEETINKSAHRITRWALFLSGNAAFRRRGASTGSRAGFPPRRRTGP